LIETQDRFSILARIYLVSFSEPLTANVPATAVERDFLNTDLINKNKKREALLLGLLKRAYRNEISEYQLIN
jgi:hypothetical protein